MQVSAVDQVVDQVVDQEERLQRYKAKVTVLNKNIISLNGLK